MSWAGAAGRRCACAGIGAAAATSASTGCPSPRRRTWRASTAASCAPGSRACGRAPSAPSWSTGSGKSHSMFGCAKQPGIVYHALRDILDGGGGCVAAGGARRMPGSGWGSLCRSPCSRFTTWRATTCSWGAEPARQGTRPRNIQLSYKLHKSLSNKQCECCGRSSLRQRRRRSRSSWRFSLKPRTMDLRGPRLYGE